MKGNESQKLYCMPADGNKMLHEAKENEQQVLQYLTSVPVIGNKILKDKLERHKDSH